MNVLISASIGLYKDKGIYYLQVISAMDDNNSYLLPISREQAVELSQREFLEIEELIN